MAMDKGSLFTKQLKHLADHEVFAAKLRLGDEETMSENAVIMGGGTSTSPIECTDDDHEFMEFHLKANPAANKSGNGFRITLYADRNLALYNRAIYTTVDIPTGKNPRNPHAIKALTKFNATSSYAQGQATAVTADIELADGTQHASMGEVTVIKAEAVLGGNSFDWGAGTKHTLLKLGVQGGNATARQKWITAIMFKGEEGNKAAKYMVSNADVTGAGGASDGGIQIDVNGTAMWLATYNI